MVREEMAAAGLDPAGLVEREIHDGAEADAAGFPGSPTILVDGDDIQAPGAEPGGLTCRVYRLRNGRISPLPDREDLREALRRPTTKD